MARSSHRGLERYLLDGERIVVAMHQHWAKVAEPVASAVVALVVVAWIDTELPRGAGVFADLVWWAWFAVLGRTLWRLANWRHDWFIATDKRLLLTYGLFTSKVAMMPLAKVTDMSYSRPLIGRVMGFGQFIMESAGQDQALKRVSYVPHPDRTYRAICAELFGVQEAAAEQDVELVEVLDPDVPLHRPIHRQANRGTEPAGDDWSREIPVHAPAREVRETPAADDTGPINLLSHWRRG